MGQPSTGAIRIVIADDHPLFRQGIKELLCTVPGFDVVAEGGNGNQALDLTIRYTPDVLLLDVEMPGPGARAVLRSVGRASPRTRVVVLTMHEESILVHELLDCGAAAYLVKTIERDELVAALRSVCRQESTVVLQVSRETFEGLDRARPGANLLSERESQVLRLVAQALSNTQIAKRLYIAEGTVKRHLTNIYAKLHAVSRVDAIRKGRAARLIPAEDDDVSQLRPEPRPGRITAG